MRSRLSIQTSFAFSLLAWALAGLGVAACACSNGGDDPASTDGNGAIPDAGLIVMPGGPMVCVGTLSGDVAGTFDCSAAANYLASEDRTSISFSTIAAPSGTKDLVVALTVPGRVMAQAYSDGDYTRTSGGLRLTDDTSYQINSMLDLGAAAVNLTSVKLLASGSGTEFFSVHGTADITTERLADRSGDITMHFEF